MTFGPRLSTPRVALPGIVIPLPFAGFLDDVSPFVRYAVKLDPWSVTAGATVSIYLADQGWTTEPDDSPANTYFEGRLTEPLEWSRRISGETLAGRSDFRSGRISFSLADRAITVGAATYTIREFFREFAMDGRLVEVRAVTDKWSNGMVLFKGTARDWSRAERGEVDIEIRGIGYLLDRPVQPATYAGTGNLEGPEELTGKAKPVSLGGTIFNVQPVTVIPGELVYQVHSDAAGSGAPINAISAVRIGGVPLTPATPADYATVAELRAATAGTGGSAIVPGQFATCLAEGYFRLGATPGATLTCDVEGGVFGGIYERLPGRLARRAAISYGAQLDAATVDAGSMATLDASRPWPLARYFGPDDRTTVAEFLDEIARAIEGSWGDNRGGQLQAFAFDAPGASASITLSQGNIEDGTFAFLSPPEEVAPALSEATVGYARNYGASSDLAASVTGDNRVRLETEWLTSTASQTVTQHAEATTYRRDTILADATGADGLRDVLLALYDGLTRRVAWTATHKALRASPGRVLSIDNPDEGLTAERVRLTGVIVQASENRIALEGVIRDG